MKIKQRRKTSDGIMNKQNKTTFRQYTNSMPELQRKIAQLLGWKAYLARQKNLFDQPKTKMINSTAMSLSR